MDVLVANPLRNRIGESFDGTELENRCYAHSLLAPQQDFQEQKGRFIEELDAVHQLAIFYPKFHLELNFMDRF